MGKILFIVLVTVLLVLWFRHMGNKRGSQPRPPSTREPEDMVRCKVCGVNMPRSEALLSRGQFYCCDEHRRSGQ